MMLDFIGKIIASDTFAAFIVFVILFGTIPIACGIWHFRVVRAESKKLEAKKRKNK